MTSLICGACKKYDTDELTYKTETHRLRKRTYSWRREGLVGEFGMDMYTLLYLKWATTKGLPYNTGSSALLRGGLDGRGMWRRIDARVCVAESFTLHLKLSQQCSLAMLLTDCTPVQNKKFTKQETSSPYQTLTNVLLRLKLGWPKTTFPLSLVATNPC